MYANALVFIFYFKKPGDIPPWRNPGDPGTDMNLGTWEIILILAGVIILFGGKKIPELARGLGESLKEFKRTASSIQDEAKQHTKEI